MRIDQLLDKAWEISEELAELVEDVKVRINDGEEPWFSDLKDDVADVVGVAFDALVMLGKLADRSDKMLRDEYARQKMAPRLEQEEV